MSIEEKYKSYQEQLEVLTENMDKYQYLINIGSKNSMPEEYKLDSFKIHGCMSQVWLVPKYNEGKITFMADSDAHITRGVVTMVADIFSGATAKQIQETNILEAGKGT